MKKYLSLAAVVLIAAACNHSAPTQDKQNQQSSNTATYTGTAKIGGFEGDYSNFEYSVTYPKTYTVKSADQGFELDQNNSAVANLKFGYNGALGAQNSKEYWSALQYCKTCKLASNDFVIPGVQDMQTYTGNGEEWVVFKAATDFGVIELKNPTQEIKNIFSTLQFTLKK